jgi:hypothetical protein
MRQITRSEAFCPKRRIPGVDSGRFGRAYS